MVVDRIVVDKVEIQRGGSGGRKEHPFLKSSLVTPISQVGHSFIILFSSDRLP